MKINLNGIYKCEPSDKYKKGDLHWCTNWTFHPRKLKDGRILMVDTYWNNYQDSLTIEVTDENIKEFEFILDYSKVKNINSHDSQFYDNVILVANDSGGWRNYKYYVLLSDNKSFKKVIDKLDYDIEEFERKVENLKNDKERLLKEGILPSWW